MKALASLFTIAAIIVSLTGCANPNLDSEAADLRAELADLPGVAAVELDYSEPITLDSGKLALTVEMSGDATADQIVAATETAYDAFRTTHRHEEADLALVAGETTVAVRAFEPEASAAAVGDATSTGLGAVPTGGSAAIDLTTQRVSKGDHVAGTYVISLPAGSRSAGVPALLESLAAEHEASSLIGWGGAAADGSSLQFDKGFPPADVVTRWSRLQDAELPLSVRALTDGVMFAEGSLLKTYDLTERADRRELDKITHAQLRTLSGAGEWAYDVYDTAGTSVASIDRYICEPIAEGPYDTELEAWALRELGPCKGI